MYIFDYLRDTSAFVEREWCSPNGWTGSLSYMIMIETLQKFISNIYIVLYHFSVKCLFYIIFMKYNSPTSSLNSFAKWKNFLLGMSNASCWWCNMNRDVADNLQTGLLVPNLIQYKIISQISIFHLSYYLDTYNIIFFSIFFVH